MKLTVLTENYAGGNFLAEHGLSYLLEIGDEKVLFDAGHSDVFLKNAEQLGIDVQNEIKTVVLSHGHWDHGDGLVHLHGQTLICHPDSFMKRYRKMNSTYLGLNQTDAELRDRFKLITSKEPIEVVPNLFFLGEIPRTFDFEAQTTMFLTEDGQPDFIPDDSALVAVDGDKIIVITGCSHSGICNIVQYAMQVTKLEKVRAVVGGLHLKRKDANTAKTIEYLKNIGVEKVLPSHCTELPAMSAFYDAFGSVPLKTGMVIEL